MSNFCASFFAEGRTVGRTNGRTFGANRRSDGRKDGRADGWKGGTIYLWKKRYYVKALGVPEEDPPTIVGQKGG